MKNIPFSDWIICLEYEDAQVHHVPGKKYTGAPGDFAPEMQKRALENPKRAPENCHRLQCKSLFNVANLVNGM